MSARAHHGLLMAGAGGDPYWPNVGSLLHFDGADASTTFSDETGKIWTPVGNAQLDTSQSRYGPSSLLLDGAGDFIASSHSVDFRADTNFVAECSIRPDDLSGIRYIATKRDTGVGREWSFYLYNGQLKLAVFDSSGSAPVDIGSVANVSVGVWSDVAWERVGNTYRIFINGNEEASVTAAFTYGTNSDPLTVGNDPSTVARYFSGHIDEFRTTRGGSVVRYGGDYTPFGPFTNF